MVDHRRTSSGELHVHVRKRSSLPWARLRRASPSPAQDAGRTLPVNKLRHLSVFAGTASILLIFLGAFYPSHAVASDQVAMSFSPVADTYVKEIFPDKN